MDGRKLAGLAAEQGRNGKRIATINRQVKALSEKARGLGLERERLLARNEAIDTGLRGLEALLAQPGGTPSVVRIHREVSAIDQLLEAIGRKGLDEFAVTELAVETGLGRALVANALATMTKAGKLHRVDRGRYRVQRGRLVS
jgi:hypothetical protein